MSRGGGCRASGGSGEGGAWSDRRRRSAEVSPCSGLWLLCSFAAVTDGAGTAGLACKSSDIVRCDLFLIHASCVMSCVYVDVFM